MDAAAYAAAAAGPHNAADAYAAAFAAMAPDDSGSDSDSDAGSTVSDVDIPVREDFRCVESIRARFMAGLGPLAPQIQVVSIQRNNFPTPISQARIDAFESFTRATARTRGGDPNVQHAWYGATNMDEILDIVKHGFGHRQLHGTGMRLSPLDCPIPCVKRAVADNDGLKHLLLCRVILGRMVTVAPGFEGQPISEEYDSAVQHVSSYKEYFIWSNNMNTHVLPEYLLSFRVLPITQGPRNVAERPVGPTIQIRTLIMALSMILPSSDMSFVSKSYQEFNDNIISLEVLVQRLRAIAGEGLLRAVIRCFQESIERRHM